MLNFFYQYGGNTKSCCYIDWPLYFKFRIMHSVEYCNALQCLILTPATWKSGWTSFAFFLCLQRNVNSKTAIDKKRQRQSEDFFLGIPMVAPNRRKGTVRIVWPCVSQVWLSNVPLVDFKPVLVAWREEWVLIWMSFHGFVVYACFILHNF